ncbi:helix-turn-helix domain-containing protein [Apilactobacillus micheneri]|uniref:helix-turn-helix domain-containing protein n=1 Tax=Apilactobacillus micheneri TaxID=1899430 RepID=UPI000D5156B7|nr:helix-turn-helix transcriptional regulator [Apilactobacillus micheneri]GAY80036.1 hypothetical protein NBRC113063_00901 [Apilactobacillus micheneri]
MKNIEMMERHKGTKNNLESIMLNNNWTSYYVSKKSGINKKTISKIVKDKFTTISSDTLLSITYNMNINLQNLIEPCDSGDIKMVHLRNTDIPKFDSKLDNIFYKYTKIHFKVYPYNDGHAVNLYSKYIHKIRFDGNFRIERDTNDSKLCLRIIDLGFIIINKYKKFNINKYLENIIVGIEKYALYLGAEKIEYALGPFFRKHKDINGYFVSYSNSNYFSIKILLKNRFNILNTNLKNKNVFDYEDVLRKIEPGDTPWLIKIL